MADLSKYNDGTNEYNFKDATARASISMIEDKIPSAASSSNKLVDTTAMNEAIGSAVGSAYKAAGNKTVAELTSSLLVEANNGNVYNMTTAGTTTADFVEGAGKPIRIGDDVGICEPTSGTFKFNILSGFIAVDTNPTQSSANPVSSGGVYSEFAGIKDGQSIDSFGDVETALAGKADKFGVDGSTIDWLQGVGVPDKLYVIDHDEIPQENEWISGLPNDEAVRKAVKSAYDLMKDTVGWSGKNLLGYKVGKSYNASGVMVDSTHGVISAIIPVSAGDKFIASKKTAISSADSNMMARQFDSNGAFVSSVKALDKADLSGVYTVPSGIAYVGFVQFYNDGTITEDIVNTYEMMLRKADILSPTYEPYRGTTAFPRDEQRVLGAKNRCPVPDKTETSRSVTYAMVKKTGIVTANGTVNTGTTSYGSIYNRTNSPLILSPNKYKMKCDFIAQTGVSVTFLCTRNGESYTYGSVNSSNDIIEADVLEGDTIGISIVCSSGTVLDNKTFAPMIWLASDPDDTYVPYAMTNRELTEAVSITELLGTDDLNNITEIGTYYWKGTAPTNSPESVAWSSMEVLMTALNDRIQVVHKGGNLIYQRVYGGSPLTWGKWHKFTGTVVS